MAIEVICSCGAKQHVPNSAEGTEVKCIRCGNLVLVTLEPQAYRPAVAAPALTERRKELENYAITVKFQAAYAGEVDHLIKILATSIGMNATAADGMKVKVGWSILTLRNRVQELTVYEPDFYQDPHKDTREDISTTLKVMAAQAKMSHMIPGIRLIGCTCFDTVQVQENVFNTRKTFMRRVKAQVHSESGLYISNTDPLEAIKAKHPEPTRNWETYMLLKERFAFIQALGLPPEYVAEFDGNEMVCIYGLKNKVVWKAH